MKIKFKIKVRLHSDNDELKKSPEDVVEHLEEWFKSKVLNKKDEVEITFDEQD
ncbi:MAG: hypothetical protein U0264_05410 [Candidatus Kapaibacterium sp.]